MNFFFHSLSRGLSHDRKVKKKDLKKNIKTFIHSFIIDTYFELLSGFYLLSERNKRCEKKRQYLYRVMIDKEKTYYLTRISNRYFQNENQLMGFDVHLFVDDVDVDVDVVVVIDLIQINLIDHEDLQP